ncbi:MAG: hypothetical protein GY932_01560, partial [Arcobacter sp.]|nr:hypothetical protein [Arcobacter sp.]
SKQKNNYIEEVNLIKTNQTKPLDLKISIENNILNIVLRNNSNKTYFIKKYLSLINSNLLCKLGTIYLELKDSNDNKLPLMVKMKRRLPKIEDYIYFNPNDTITKKYDLNLYFSINKLNIDKYTVTAYYCDDYSYIKSKIKLDDMLLLKEKLKSNTITVFKK